jgi:nitroimidazol reductase NimA-like FMN-containing flavoprotein (pyridoxamine 5'-phosphate oxidase superfamily)
MRRSEKEIKDPAEIEDILQKAKICRLAMCERGFPYIVPVCFGYENRCLYVHCDLEGKKLDILHANREVCFQVETDVEFVGSDSACEWTLKYRSVIGKGRAKVVKEEKEKIKALKILMNHYSSRNHQIDKTCLPSVGIILIEIYEMTGKKSGY